MDSNLMELNVQVNEGRFIDKVKRKCNGVKYKTMMSSTTAGS